ncbi:hypothetical protein C2W62_29760 [Candidatus Entotheonella serta]|nr:hypothetical protein C2W62_29760 [Candidatus Entotheonella serta]
MYMLTHADQFKAATTYNAAAAHCDEPSLAFWTYAGQHQIGLGEAEIRLWLRTRTSSCYMSKRIGIGLIV